MPLAVAVGFILFTLRHDILMFCCFFRPLKEILFVYLSSRRVFLKFCTLMSSRPPLSRNCDALYQPISSPLRFPLTGSLHFVLIPLCSTVFYLSTCVSSCELKIESFSCSMESEETIGCSSPNSTKSFSCMTDQATLSRLLLVTSWLELKQGKRLY